MILKGSPGAGWDGDVQIATFSNWSHLGAAKALWLIPMMAKSPAMRPSRVSSRYVMQATLHLVLKVEYTCCNCTDLALAVEFGSSALKVWYFGVAQMHRSGVGVTGQNDRLSAKC
jgi:hypothetical protein